MRIRSLIILILLTVVIPAFGITPEEVMRKTVSKLESASGISAVVSVKGGMGDGSATVLTDGNRSFMESPQVGKQWFDGVNMWTLNPKTKEVTVSRPDPSELLDANPLLYLKGYEGRYRLYFSKRKESGRYLVLLNPRGKSDVKAIEVAVNNKTFLPERIILRSQDDVRSTVLISKLDLNRKFKAGEFNFPSNKYKDYEIVDLR